MPHMTRYPYLGPQYVVNNSVPMSAQLPADRPQSARQGGNRAATWQQSAQPQRQGDQSYNVRESGGYPRGGRGRRSYDNRRSSRDECWRCGQRGHYRSECPVPAYTLNQVGHGDNVNDSQRLNTQMDDHNVNLLSCRNEAETYIDINLKGRTVQALLDTGSDLSICPFRLCKSAKITPVTMELYAANETPVKVLGQTRIYFSVSDLNSYADVLVSDQIDELLLGFDYMKRNNCSWVFDTDRFIIHGRSVPLRTRQNKAKGVRRCFVREPVVIPPDTAINVPVRLPFHNLREPVADWVVENKQVRPGVLTARTLLPHNSDYAAIAVLNMSGVQQALKSGLEIGRARICPRKLIAEFDCVNSCDTECVANDGCDEAVVTVVDRDSDVTSVKFANTEGNESFHETALRQQPVPPRANSASGGQDPSAARECACVQTCAACRCTLVSGERGRPASCREPRQTIGPGCGINNAGIPSAVYVSRAVGEDAIQQTEGDRRTADSVDGVREYVGADIGGRLLGGQRVRAAAAARPCDGVSDRRPAERATLSTDGVSVSAASLKLGASDPELRPRPTAAQSARSVVKAAPVANGEDYYPLISVNSTVNSNSAPFVPDESCAVSVCDVDNVASHVSANVGIEPAVKRLYTLHASFPSDTSHIQPVIDMLPDCLSPEQRVKAIELIKSNADIFSRHEFDVGCTDLMTASIETGNSRPIAEPLRRHARGHLDIIDETIDRMEAAGIISKCSSPWSFNLVVVSRYDDQGKPTTPRITIDYRKLNAITYKDRYPLPNIKDCLQSLSNVSWLSSMDISSAFYQVPIRDQDKDKTAFLTRKGQYRLERMGMGLTNSPAHFARLMCCLLRGLKCCLAFLDDTLCFSTTFDDHLSDLQQMFDRFRAANLKLKPKKCKLFQTETDFLGHHVSRSGLAPQQAKVACVQNWPFPTNITELRAYLGLCSYYRSYIKGFAAIAEPLTECLRRGVALEKTPRRVEAFEKLKASLLSAPILAVPRDDPECRYVIDTDASNHSAGAVCQQWQDGKLRVIEYASRAFSRAERSYCSTRREMSALIFALRQFRPYLLCREFDIRVDNQALSFFQRLKNPGAQAARYLDFLADFQYKIIFRRGASSGNADGLSRFPPCSVKDGEPCDQCLKRVIGKHQVNAVQTRARVKADAAQQSADPTDPAATVNGPPLSDTATAADQKSTQSAGDNYSTPRKRRKITRRGPTLQSIAPKAWEYGALNWTDKSLRQAQLTDPNIGPAISWIETNERPIWSAIEAKSPMLRALWTQFASLHLINGVLFREFYDHKGEVQHNQLVLPREMRVPFLELIHNDISGHLKLAKCIPQIMRRAWWYGWRADLNLFIRTCAKCESFHRGKVPRQHLMKSTHAGFPWEKVCIDLQGPFPESNGHKFILTALCNFSKFGVCVALRNKEASTVAKALVEHVFLRFGLCHTILSDLGKEFECELLNELSAVLGVTKLRTTSFTPSANGAVENWHKLINAMFAKCVRQDQRDWADWLQYVAFAYNAAEHSATKFSPFYIFTGRTPIWTVDLLLPQTVDGERNVPEYVRNVTHKLHCVFDLVRENLNQAWLNSSRWYNKKTHPKSFEPGDRVRVYYPRRYKGKTPKWQNFFATEAVVAKKINDATYIVSAKGWKSPRLIHVDKLKPIVQFQ